jgi:DNA polymerase-1
MACIAAGGVDVTQLFNNRLDPWHFAARANPFGIVHATWLAFRTWTGRSTAVRPAIQQVPRHLRQAFRAPPGHVFILADWSHAQARILAGASRDPDLLTVLSDPGRDLYIEIGQDAAPDTPDVRALGKRLLIPLLFHAGPKRLQQRAAEVGVTLSLEEAKYVKARFMARFKVFAAWREGLKTMTSFRSPAGRMVTVPPPDPRRRRGSALSRITAGIAQSAEADALGLVVGGWRREVPPDQGGIVLLMHDGIVFDVREENATATTARVDRLMESSLRAVCGPCRPAWSIETRRTWGKP